MATSYILLLALGQLHFTKVMVSINDILISVLLFAIVAIVEEVLLRGYVLRNFMQSFNKYIALVLSSLLFAVMHLANPNMDWFSFLNLF